MSGCPLFGGVVVTRSQRSEQTRQNLIDVACKLFISQGYHGTTTRQITGGANTAAGTIYNHFDSKEEIFEAILELYHPWIFIPEAVSKANGETLESLVHDAYNRLQAIWNENPGLTKIHLIELLEFQGKHLPKLFRDLFDKLAKIFDQKAEDHPFLNSVPKARGLRRLIGLFFTAQVANEFKVIGIEQDFDDFSFDYFSDIYLQVMFEEFADDDSEN